MAITLANLQRKNERKPPRIIVHGPRGVGKTTLLASLPEPALVQVEDGLGKIDIPHFPLAKSFSDVQEAIGAAVDAGEFKTIILDSLDHFEALVWAEACKRNGVNSVEDIGGGFGKGYLEADKVWREFMDLVNSARNDADMIVAMTAHSDVRTFKDPEGAAYDRYEMKLHKRANAFLQEKADLILFANFDTATSEIKEGSQKRTVGRGGQTRSLYSEHRAAFDAKNRYDLPPKVALVKPFDWSQYAEAFPTSYFN